MHTVLVFVALFGVVFAADPPKFLQVVNNDDPQPAPRSVDILMFANSTTTTTAKPSSANDQKAALNDALIREQALKRELDDVKNALQVFKMPNAAVAIPVSGVQGQSTTGNKATVAVVPAISQQDQSAQLTAKLLGQNGLLSILNPRIMDQQDAAAKLIPALTLPQTQRQGQGIQQLGQVPQQNNGGFQQQPNNQLDPRQYNQFNQGQPQGGFGQMQQPQGAFGQPQYPVQNNGAYLPQQSFQQPTYAANPFGANPMNGQQGMLPQQPLNVPQGGGMNGMFGR